MKHSIWILLLGISCLTVNAQELNPGADEALIKIRVMDRFEIPEVGAEVVLLESPTERVLRNKTDSAGAWDLIVKQGNSYNIKITQYGTEFEFGTKEIPVVGGPLEFSMKFKIGVDTMFKRIYVLENVYFDYDRASLRPESSEALDALVSTMKGSPTMKIEIAGHTDNKGSDEYNLKLSQKRASSVVRYLMKNGIEEGRAHPKGYGERIPVASNDTDEGRQKNRRTEVRIIEQ